MICCEADTINQNQCCKKISNNTICNDKNVISMCNGTCKDKSECNATCNSICKDNRSCNVTYEDNCRCKVQCNNTNSCCTQGFKKNL